MSAKLASDLDNPDFAGAVNPDSRLAVIFFTRPLQNEFRTNAEGRPIFEDVEFVRIQVPGDTTTVIEAPVREEHKRRFPLHWAHYQNTQGKEPKEIGTPLDQWPRMTKAQVEELRALKFQTVEHVAFASDANIQKLGMLAGMSPYAFRDLAKRFLDVAKDDAAVGAADERAKVLEEENRKLREEMEAKALETQKQLEEMRDLIIAQAPKKRGRKPKAEA